MTYQPSPEMDQIIDLLFGSDKEPHFVDGSVEVIEFLDDDGKDWLRPSEFSARLSDMFGIQFSEEQLRLTIPQLADYVRQRRSTAEA